MKQEYRIEDDILFRLGMLNSRTLLNPQHFGRNDKVDLISIETHALVYKSLKY